MGRAGKSLLPLCAISFSSPISSHHLHPISNLDTIDLSSDCSSELASSTTTPLSLNVEEVCSPSTGSKSPGLQPTNNTLSCPPSPATTVAPAKGLYSYFHTIPSGTQKRSHHSDQSSQPSPKRVCRPPTPTKSSSCKSKAVQMQWPPNSTGTPSVSATYLNKQALNKAVKEGTFKHDECKWAAFKSKIMTIDPQSEVNDVNPRRACHVLHVKCGKSVVMSMPSDATARLSSAQLG